MKTMSVNGELKGYDHYVFILITVVSIMSKYSHTQSNTGPSWIAIEIQRRHSSYYTQFTFFNKPLKTYHIG